MTDERPASGWEALPPLTGPGRSIASRQRRRSPLPVVEKQIGHLSGEVYTASTALHGCNVSTNIDVSVNVD